MEISTCLKDYKSLGEYFSQDYGRDNEVLSRFKQLNPELSARQVGELKEILENSASINDKYFASDLLYLYDSFSTDLLEPLLKCAIEHEDPSFNRVFLRPCIIVFGFDNVKNRLAEKDETGNPTIKEGIKRLQYWLWPKENW